MSDKPAIVRLFDYGEWANHRFLDIVATLGADDFRRDLRGSHGGVRGTLVHTYGAELVWHDRFKGVATASLPVEDDVPDVTALRERWAALEADRHAWLTALGAEAGEQVIAYRSLKGDPFASRLWLLVQHVANHGSYHRGQVAAFLRQLGTKPPTTDLVVFDREQRERGLA
jgi:uncharacterized damage-inducible protein DinB